MHDVLNADKILKQEIKHCVSTRPRPFIVYSQLINILSSEK